MARETLNALQDRRRPDGVAAYFWMYLGQDRFRSRLALFGFQIVAHSNRTLPKATFAPTASALLSTAKKELVTNFHLLNHSVSL